MTKRIPRGDEHLICPLHRASMANHCHLCPWWVQIRGFNPNTGQEIDDWSCAIGVLPMLMVNVANETRQGAAATESFRNESLKLGALQLRHPAFQPASMMAVDSQNIPKLLGSAPLKDDVS